jgi:hypothetical protein
VTSVGDRSNTRATGTGAVLRLSTTLLSCVQDSCQGSSMRATSVVRRRTIVAFALVILVSSAFTFDSQAVRMDSAGATSPPVCRTSRLAISASRGVVAPATGNVTFLLQFKNTGRTCDLLGDAPEIQAVSGKSYSPVGTPTANDLLLFRPVTLRKGQHSLSDLLVASTTGSMTARCKPATATGILVSDGVPLRSTKYVPLVLRHVCSAQWVGNLGASDYDRTSG